MQNTASICLNCRLSFKQNDKCPTCGGDLIDMGKNFKAPRRSALTQWRKVAMMVGHGCRNARPRRTWPSTKAPYGRIVCSCEHCSSFFRTRLRVWKPRTLSDAKNQIHLRRSGTKVYA